jgi:hypothetical protein
MIDHLYRFVSVCLFGVVLYYEGNLPALVQWLVSLVIIATGVGAVVAIKASREKRARERLQVEQEHLQAAKREAVAGAAKRILVRMQELSAHKISNDFTTSSFAQDELLAIRADIVSEALDLLRANGQIECFGGHYSLTHRPLP